MSDEVRQNLNPVFRGEDKVYVFHLTDKSDDTDIDLTGLTGSDIQFSVKKTVDDPDYQIHKDLGPASKSSISIGTANSQLDYEAQDNGIDGNDIAIQYLDPGANNSALAVTFSEVVVGNVRQKNIIVSLATDSGGTITSTANQIKTAIENNVTANALVAITVPGTGADVVSAVAQTFLTGGLSGGIALIVPETGGKFRVTIPRADTFAVPAGLNVFDAVVILSSARTLVVFGNVQYNTGVTE